MAIDSYLTLETTITQDVVMDLLNLIQTYSNPFLQIHLHPQFPLKPLYRIFRPYLKLYYRMKLHVCPAMEERLRHGLCCFAWFNPQFGRKYVRDDDDDFAGFDDRHLEYGDFTEGAFYELRDMSVFEIIKKYRKNRNNMFCISIEPLKNVKYVYGESIIKYPVLHIAEEEASDDEPEEDEESIS
jgi:hypothetical protein